MAAVEHWRPGVQEVPAGRLIRGPQRYLQTLLLAVKHTLSLDYGVIGIARDAVSADRARRQRAPYAPSDGDMQAMLIAAIAQI